MKQSNCSWNIFLKNEVLIFLLEPIEWNEKWCVLILLLWRPCGWTLESYLQKKVVERLTKNLYLRVGQQERHSVKARLGYFLRKLFNFFVKQPIFQFQGKLSGDPETQILSDLHDWYHGAFLQGQCSACIHKWFQFNLVSNKGNVSCLAI